MNFIIIIIINVWYDLKFKAVLIYKRRMTKIDLFYKIEQILHKK